MLAQFINFFNFLSFYSIIVADIKLEDLYLSKDELKDVMQLVAKKKTLRTIKINRVIDYIKCLRNNLKIRKE